MSKYITDDERYYILSYMKDEFETQDITSVCDLICLYAILESPLLLNYKPAYVSSFPKTIGRYTYRLIHGWDYVISVRKHRLGLSI